MPSGGVELIFAHVAPQVQVACESLLLMKRKLIWYVAPRYNATLIKDQFYPTSSRNAGRFGSAVSSKNDCQPRLDILRWVKVTRLLIAPRQPGKDSAPGAGLEREKSQARALYGEPTVRIRLILYGLTCNSPNSLHLQVAPMSPGLPAS